VGIGEEHRLRIAYDTLAMGPVMARVMGGMTYAEAEELVREDKERCWCGTGKRGEHADGVRSHYPKEDERGTEGK